MTETGLSLSLTAAEGALRRVFGTVEHRGFHVLSCDVRSNATHEEYRVRLLVEGERDPALLVRQLMRLHDVHAAGVHVDAAVA